MSTLKTNAIQTIAGKPILNSTGSIIQVVQGILTSSFTCVSNGTVTAITGLSASITPTSTSSRILIMVSLSHSVTQAATTYGGRVRRNGVTDIQLGDASGSKQQCNVPLTWAGDANQHNAFAWSVVDSPATTSSTTYGVYVINDNGNTLFVNRTGNDSDTSTGKRSISTITLLEFTA
jgi:hypothetical protein